MLSRCFQWWSAGLLLSVLLAACGGGSGDVGTREQFIAAADSACSRFSPPLGRFLAGGDGGGNLITGINRFADRVERFVADIERLELPRGRERLKASMFVASIRRLAPAAGSLRTATARLAATSPTDAGGVGGAIARLGVVGQKLDRLAGEAGRLAHADGLKACANALRPPPASNPSRSEPPVSDPLKQVLPPAGTARAARRRFLAGRTVAAQSGCVACHRLAGGGNSGPAPPLDDIGTRLSRSAIARVLRNPVAPMPSYQNLASAKFDALVAFLAGLRQHAP